MLSIEIRTGLELSIKLDEIFKDSDETDMLTPIKMAIPMIVHNLTPRLVMRLLRRY